MTNFTKEQVISKFNSTYDGLSEKEAIIQDNIIEVFRKYTIEDLDEQKGLQKLKNEILKDEALNNEIQKLINRIR